MRQDGLSIAPRTYDPIATMPTEPSRAVETAHAMSVNDAIKAGLDPTNPESLFAFFELQMQGVQSRLRAAMQDQDARANRVERLHAIQGDVDRVLQSAGDKPIGSDSPLWSQLRDDLVEAIALAGPQSKVGTAMQAMLDDVRGKTGLVAADDKQQAESTARMISDSKVIATTEGGVTKHSVQVVTQAPKPIGLQQLKDLSADLKNVADGLSGETGLAMIRVQQLMEQSSQITNHCSNVMKKFHEMNMAAIDNIR